MTRRKQGVMLTVEPSTTVISMNNTDPFRSHDRFYAVLGWHPKPRGVPDWISKRRAVDRFEVLTGRIL